MSAELFSQGGNNGKNWNEDITPVIGKLRTFGTELRTFAMAGPNICTRTPYVL
jgi:hypothetical protein